MTSWLGAMVAGDGKTVCDLMATGRQGDLEHPGRGRRPAARRSRRCSTRSSSSARPSRGSRSRGATVKGNTATFESVTTTPALAADVVSSFKAVKIDGKWYISQG